MNQTIVLRLPVVDAVSNPPLGQRLEDLCNVQAAAGMMLAAAFVLGTEIVLIFQRP